MSGGPDLTAAAAEPGRVLRVSAGLVAVAIAVFLVRTLTANPLGPIVHADFDRAGLNVRAGDEVRVRGVPVGEIRAIRVDPSDLSARYELVLDPGTSIAADSGARVVPKTLLGDKYIELDAAAPGEPVLADGALIPRERTEPVAELEEVLDEIGTLIGSIDAAALGGALNAVAYGLGDGTSLRSATAGLGAAADVTASSRDDLHRLLDDLPDVATTFAERAEDVTIMAEGFSQVLATIDEHQTDLTVALQRNADLLADARTLVEDPRLARTVRDGLVVLDIVTQHPGRIAAYLRAFPVYLEGLVSATFIDHLYAQVAHTFVVLPHLDGHGGDDDGGREAGPHVVIKTPPPEDQPGGGAP
ncbi:MAG: MCE family protein [Actinobacteria bacterium]|nr:MCE family protein [Actinomycetota bacterium]